MLISYLNIRKPYSEINLGPIRANFSGQNMIVIGAACILKYIVYSFHKYVFNIFMFNQIKFVNLGVISTRQHFVFQSSISILIFLYFL